MSGSLAGASSVIGFAKLSNAMITILIQISYKFDNKHIVWMPNLKGSLVVTRTFLGNLIVLDACIVGFLQ